MKLILACVLFIGLVSLLGFGFECMDEGKSSSWPTTDAKLIDIEDRHVSMPILNRFIPIATPYAKYSYSVNGKEYIGEKTCGPCISWVRRATFKAPEIEVVDRAEILRKLREGGAQVDFAKAMKVASDLAENINYKPIKVRYQPDHPENSVPDPDVIQAGASLWWTSVLLILAGGLGLGAMIYHSYITEPVEDDPALSLDAALRAQQRRK
jgi:hypothetical protein